MQIVYHLGAHCTDEDRLLRGILKDRETLVGRGVIAPAPRRYRPLLHETLAALQGAAAPAEVQDALLDALAESDGIARLIFSYADVLSLPAEVVSPAGYYAHAGPQAAALTGLFPQADTEFFLALCNPATQIPALIGRAGNPDYTAFMCDHDPLSLTWAPVVRAIRAAAPRARLVVWCNEDSPVIWSDLLQALSGAPPGTVMAGRTDLVDHLIGAAAAARLQQFLVRHPPRRPEALHRIFAAFLDHFAPPQALSVAVSLPGWDDELIAEMTAAYDRDLDEIAALPGVELILP